MPKTPITVAYGDGIGPEITDATIHILQEAGAAVEIEPVEIGEKVYLRGNPAGIEPGAWESLRRTRVFLKAPITIPQGVGYKSLNVTTRKTLGLYANVRPCVSYHPFIETQHPNMDVVIVRENEEDLYAGIEYRLSSAAAEAVKLITRPGSEKIVRYAFEYALRHNRKKVSCFTKDNVMKMSDGLFHRVFDEIAAQYPDIQNEHWTVDLGAAKLADTPGAFDVVVLPNLYGDILADVAAHVAGSVGLTGSANVGDQCAMFEAVHGSAPRRANQNLANPSGLLLAAVLMLVHIDQPEVAERVHNAWLRTIEDGVHTYDIFTNGVSAEKVGTRQFAEAVVARLGQKPHTLKPVHYRHVAGRPTGVAEIREQPEAKKELAGVDVFVEWASRDPNRLAEALQRFNDGGLVLTMISTRGVKVWPEGSPDTFCIDNFQCRFTTRDSGVAVTQSQVVGLLDRVSRAGIGIVQTHSLYTFNGEPGYSLT